MKKKLTLLDSQLEVFIALCHFRSMHKTSKAIYISQTAITQRIRALEAKLKTTLFIRTNKGVELTPDADALLRYCNNVIQLEGETLAKIQQVGIETTVRVNITGPTSVMTSRIIPNCLPVMKKFPALLVTFDIDDSAQKLRSLQTGKSQFAIIEPEMSSKEFSTKKLLLEQYVLVCSTKWKKRDLEDILKTERIIDFDEEDPMTINYLKYFNLLGKANMDRHFVNRTDSLSTMLIEGYGYGVLTKEFSQPYLDSNKMMVLNEGKSYKNSLLLAWYNRPEPPPYFLEILKVLK